MFTTSIGAWAGALLGLVYPTYASFKAIESRDVTDDTQWLTYWIAYAVLATAEAFAGFILAWIPLYYEIKFVFIAWLVAPQTKGAKLLYTKYIKPFLNKHAAQLDPVFSGTSAVLESNVTGMALSMAEKYGPNVTAQAMKMAFDQAASLQAGMAQPAGPTAARQAPLPTSTHYD